MIVVAGSARIRADKRDEAIAASKKMMDATRTEPGCREYRYGFAVDDPDVVMVFEEWEDQAALDAHFQAPHMAEFMVVLGEIIAGDAEFTRYEIAASGPLLA